MEDKNIVTFLGEEGEKIEFEVVEVINVENDRYALLAPVGEDEDAYVYKIVENNGKDEYIAVEDEKEFDKVIAAYDASFDEEFDK